MTLILDENKRKLNIKKFFEGKIKPSILRNSKAHNNALSNVQKKLQITRLAMIEQYSRFWFAPPEITSKNSKPTDQSINLLTNFKKPRKNTKSIKSKIDFHCYEEVDFEILDNIQKNQTKKR